MVIKLDGRIFLHHWPRLLTRDLTFLMDSAEVKVSGWNSNS